MAVASKKLHAVVNKPSALWRKVSFKANLADAATPSKAQWFLAWLSNKATAVEGLDIQLAGPRNAQADAAVAAVVAVNRGRCACVLYGI